MSNNFYSLLINSGSFAIELYGRSGLAANYSLALPNVAPTDGQYLRYDSAANALVWGVPAVGGGGTVSSVALALPTDLFDVSGSPVTSAGTLTAVLDSQTANRVFAAPSGANGVPTFRALVNADIPSGIDASKISGTLGKANIPNGTNATSFQLSGITGVTLGTDAGGNLFVYSADGSTKSDIYARKLFVESIDNVSSTNINYGDATLTLLADFVTGTPSVDAGITIRRGSSANSQLLWNETSDKWQVGASDNLRDIAREVSVSITNADISGGVYTFNHGLRATTNDPVIIVKRGDNRVICLGITYTSADVATIDFSKVGVLSGTWRLTAFG